MACLLYPNGKMPTSASFPSQTVEDLQLDRLADAMSISEYYRVNADELCALFTEDLEIICWRQAVIRDILQLSGLDEALSRLLDSLDGWEGRSSGRRGADSFAVGFSLEDFSWLDGYLRKVDASWAELSRFPVESEGLRILIGLLDGLRNSPRYQSTASDFEALCSGHSAPASMRIGYNLDKDLKPSRLKLLRMDPPAEKKAKGKSTQKRQMMLNQRAIEMDAMLLQRLSAQASQDIGSFVIRDFLRNLSLLFTGTVLQFASLDADAFNQTLGQLFLAVHVNQLIFEGRGTCVHNQNFHIVSCSFI